MTQYVYSITIQKENDFLSFLKSFDSLIKVNDKLITETNNQGVLSDGDSVQTFSYIGAHTADTFEEMYEWWRGLTIKWKLSMEYVKDEWVYILAFHQLHSGVDKPFNQRIIHNGVPTRRKSKKVIDLRLRRAEPRDYGSGETDDLVSKQGDLKSQLTNKEWLARWHMRYTYLAHHYADCICGAIDWSTARDLFLQAFVLTVADIHFYNNDSVPDLVNHLTIWDAAQTGTPYLGVQCWGQTPVKEGTEQYRLYIEPTLQGKAWELAPRNSFYSRESAGELHDLYFAAIGLYSELYGTP